MLLTEHATEEQLADIDAKLNAPMNTDPERERAIVASIAGIFANPDDD